MVTIGMICFPTESSKEVGKCFMKLPSLPPFMTRRGPYVNSECGVGIKTISIFEYDPSKKAEADEFLGNYYATFFGIPGFTYSIGTWFEIKEAFKMIGLG